MANYPEDWDDLRRYIYIRDNYICQKCGATDVELHAHHIIPLISGGSNHPSNLATLCRNCHADIHPHLEREPYYGTRTEDIESYGTQEEYKDLLIGLILTGMGIYFITGGGPVFVFVGIIWIIMGVIIVIELIIATIRKIIK
ncbi:hypothetical protein BEH94_11960 [Candidatus Altiarchaeales archaeon WOR_SM1_SCG]|nr:hypothetical protein BEH94_11960 [Candidatus Altiarchaeales archaeon WOR_SM1_SCG]